MLSIRDLYGGSRFLGPSLKERLEVTHRRQWLADAVVEPFDVLAHIMRCPEDVNALLFEYAGGRFILRHILHKAIVRSS